MNHSKIISNISFFVFNIKLLASPRLLEMPFSNPPYSVQPDSYRIGDLIKDF